MEANNFTIKTESGWVVTSLNDTNFYLITRAEQKYIRLEFEKRKRLQNTFSLQQLSSRSILQSVPPEVHTELVSAAINVHSEDEHILVLDVKTPISVMNKCPDFDQARIEFKEYYHFLDKLVTKFPNLIKYYSLYLFEKGKDLLKSTYSDETEKDKALSKFDDILEETNFNIKNTLLDIKGNLTFSRDILYWVKSTNQSWERFLIKKRVRLGQVVAHILWDIEGEGLIREFDIFSSLSEVNYDISTLTKDEAFKLITVVLVH